MSRPTSPQDILTDHAEVQANCALVFHDYGTLDPSAQYGGFDHSSLCGGFLFHLETRRDCLEGAGLDWPLLTKIKPSVKMLFLTMGSRGAKQVSHFQLGQFLMAQPVLDRREGLIALVVAVIASLAGKPLEEIKALLLCKDVECASLDTH